MPPMTTVASGRCTSAPACDEIAIGMNPNAATATYPYVHTLTGKTIVVDTSYGASAMSDSWSNQPANVLNNHIMNGVIGVNIASNPPSNYQQLITNLGKLSSTCP